MAVVEGGLAPGALAPRNPRPEGKKWRLEKRPREGGKTGSGRENVKRSSLSQTRSQSHDKRSTPAAGQLKNTKKSAEKKKGRPPKSQKRGATGAPARRPIPKGNENSPRPGKQGKSGNHPNTVGRVQGRPRQPVWEGTTKPTQGGRKGQTCAAHRRKNQQKKTKTQAECKKKTGSDRRSRRKAKDKHETCTRGMGAKSAKRSGQKKKREKW